MRGTLNLTQIVHLRVNVVSLFSPLTPPLPSYPYLHAQPPSSLYAPDSKTAATPRATSATSLRPGDPACRTILHSATPCPASTISQNKHVDATHRAACMAGMADTGGGTGVYRLLLHLGRILALSTIREGRLHLHRAEARAALRHQALPTLLIHHRHLHRRRRHPQNRPNLLQVVLALLRYWATSAPARSPTKA